MLYIPALPPSTYDTLWLQRELKRIADTFEAGSDVLRISSTNTSPEKVAENTIRVADGNWDPGQGQGTYIYRRGKWYLIEDGANSLLRSRAFFLSD